MAKRLAILDSVSFAMIPQPPYASTTRGTHIQPLIRHNPKHCFLISVAGSAEAPEVCDQHRSEINELLRDV